MDKSPYKALMDAFDSGRLFAECMFKDTMPRPEACEVLAKEVTAGMSREELVKFVGEMVYGIACIKQNIVNMKLFGRKNARL